MYGTKRELATVRCRVCKRWTALRVDKDDLARMLYGGALVQDCMPYLSADDRELLLTATRPKEPEPAPESAPEVEPAAEPAEPDAKDAA